MFRSQRFYSVFRKHKLNFLVSFALVAGGSKVYSFMEVINCLFWGILKTKTTISKINHSPYIRLANAYSIFICECSKLINFDYSLIWSVNSYLVTSFFLALHSVYFADNNKLLHTHLIIYLFDKLFSSFFLSCYFFKLYELYQQLHAPGENKCFDLKKHQKYEINNFKVDVCGLK